jgi:O-antigen/teichoic acid export membrane protein
VVPVLLIANLLLGVYYNFSIWYRLKDRTGLGAWISVVSALLTIGLNFVLIPLFGYQGASWVTLICYAYLCFATWYTGKKHYPVPYAMGRMSAYVALVFVLWGIDQLLQPFLAGVPLLLWGTKVILFGAFAGVVFQLELRNKIFKSA